MSGSNTRQSNDNDDPRDQPTADRGATGVQQERSLAEWVTLAISVAIVLGLLGLVTYLYLDDGLTSAVIEVTPLIGETRESGARFYVPVEIENTGGKTVEQLLVTVSLTLPNGSTEDAQFTVDFLAGGASQGAVASFSEDPREHEVGVSAVSYVEP